MVDQLNRNGMIKVKIHGQEYPIKADGGNVEYIQRLASYVDEIMSQINEKTHVSSETRLAVLAALNIADELFIALAERNDLIKSYEDKKRQIQEDLNMN